jgi:hypothetical protein
MKLKIIFSITFYLGFAAATAMAQQFVSGIEVCQQMANISTTNASTCAGIVSRSRFTPELVEVAKASLAVSSNTALELLKIGADQPLDPAMMSVCDKIIKNNRNNTETINCVTAIVGNNFYDAFATIATLLELAENSSTYTVNGVKTVANKYFQPEVLAVCERIIKNNKNSIATINCLDAVANKSFPNQSYQICLSLADQSSNSAVNCLLNTGVQYVPPVIITNPPIPPTNNNPGNQNAYVQIPRSVLGAMMKDLSLTSRLIDQGRIDDAQIKINELLNLLQNIRK